MKKIKKILIVDDEPNIVMALEYYFRKKKYEVYIGRDGEEALAIAEEYMPDLIFLDIMMPKMDGYMTMDAISQIPALADTKIVIISAKTSESDIEKGLSYGADAYVTKPFTMKKIEETIELIK